MAPARNARRSRRLSRKSPLPSADYDWQGASLQLLHTLPDAALTPPPVHLPPPSPSACTSASSPPAVVTHLPFTPGSSHTRNRKEGHIPRPPNAFMVFRSWLWNVDNLKHIERDNRNVSRIAGRYWNELSEAERAPFRCMAEEAKARHAQLYPEYRYSPGSQKKPKVSQRRCQRTTDLENDKCKKVADLLLGGVTSRDLPKYLAEEHVKVKPEEDHTLIPAAEQPMSSRLQLDATLQNVLERSPVPLHPQPQSEVSNVPPAPLIPIPLSHYSVPVLVPQITEERPEVPHTPGPSMHAPVLVCPSNDADFVATDDIPYLSLDSCDSATIKNHGDISKSFPSHLRPGACSVFSGVKPEATSFVNTCVLGAYTADALVMPNSFPFTDFDIEPYPSLVPLGSPVFTNPFESYTLTANNSALLGTLDQLFGQPISPLTPVYPDEN